MTTRRPWARPLAALAGAALLLGLVPVTSAGAAAPPTDTRAIPPVRSLSPADEARIVDRVPTPRPRWFSCSTFAPGAQCATVALPLDYDHPRGPTTDVAVLRLRARDPGRRIGTLFLNPGGPGGSGVQIASNAPYFLGADVLDRFDVVGFDPRGTNFSAPVRCWRDLGAQEDALAPILSVPFPAGRTETRRYVSASQAFGRACASKGAPLSAAMSTAEVARDMDVLRRMTGDRALSYLGFSYGSYLGTVYSQMFPGRVRAVAIDGVLDPVAWAGTGRDGTRIPQTQRLGSGEAGAAALTEVLRRCEAAGPDHCLLARRGEPVALYRAIDAALRRRPLVVTDPDTGEVLLRITRAEVTGVLLAALYAPDGAGPADSFLDALATLVLEGSPGGSTTPSRAGAVAAARSLVVETFAARDRAARGAAAEQRRLGRAVGWGFPYDNGPEAFQSVLCTDGRNPAQAGEWALHAAGADRRAPGFGPLWTWASAPCAGSTWTARDEDAYRGPFTRVTSRPVLVVGNYWDPATSYRGAVATSGLLPGSRLLSSDSWGHTAYGTSTCVTDAVDRYLLTSRVPPAGTRCVGDVQPFVEPLGEGPGLRTRTTGGGLPPVVPPVPGGLPRG